MTQDLLEGIKVLDAASFLAGPAAATLMADYGASVTKVEPLDGDAFRLIAGHSENFSWNLTGRNKRSVALDLSKGAGKAIFIDLIKGADVVILNLLPDQLKRFGLTYPELRRYNDRLIYAHVSGFGAEGKQANERSYDLTAFFAKSGILEIGRLKGSRPPLPPGGVGDHMTALALFSGVLLALIRRHSTGEGCEIRASLLGTAAWANGFALQAMLQGINVTRRRDDEGDTYPFVNTYETADQRYFVLGMVNGWKHWKPLARALGKQFWLDDPRYVDLASLMRHRRELYNDLVETFAALDLEQVSQLLTGAGVPFAPVSSLEEVVSDQQVLDNQFVVETGSTEPTFRRTIAPPIQFGGARPSRTIQRAPRLGEHTREVLREIGYDDEIINLIIAGGFARQEPREAESA